MEDTGTTVNTVEETLSTATTQSSTWAVLAKAGSQGLAAWIWVVIAVGMALGVVAAVLLLRRVARRSEVGPVEADERLGPS